MTPARCAAAAVTCAAIVAALAAADVNDWPSHDHDAGAQRFSPLKQITPANAAKLQPAWTFDAGAAGIQVTPLVVGGIMYVTAGRDVVALEPETARVVWRYTAPAAVSRRGLAYWPGDRDTPPRLFSGAGDRLVAVDAERGKPSAGFGDDGSVDLKASVRGDVDGEQSIAGAAEQARWRVAIARPIGSAALADRRRRRVLPDDLRRLWLEGEHVLAGGDVHDAVDHDRRHLKARDTGFERPRRLKRRDVGRRDLRQRREALAAGIVVVRRPVVDADGDDTGGERRGQRGAREDLLHQYVNFNANCMILGSPAVWMVPKLPLFSAVTGAL